MGNILNVHKEKIEKMITEIFNQDNADFTDIYIIAQTIAEKINQKIQGLRVSPESDAGKIITFTFRKKSKIVGSLIIKIGAEIKFNWDYS